MRRRTHPESHLVERIGWLRAAVLGANASLLFLAVLGAGGAKAGGADIVRGVLRVTFWGEIAMAATALIGKVFGTGV
jgi:VIT1/CCC1 family predicted Fe2+/Mn2+ transporter